MPAAVLAGEVKQLIWVEESILRPLSLRADPIPGHRREKLRERASSGKSWFGRYSPRVKPANPLLRLIPLLAVSAWLAGTTVQAAAPAPATGLASIRVPEGFQVSLAAGGDLAPYAMFGARDDRGRLFLAESSGKNIKGLAMAQAPVTPESIGRFSGTWKGAKAMTNTISPAPMVKIIPVRLSDSVQA